MGQLSSLEVRSIGKTYTTLASNPNKKRKKERKKQRRRRKKKRETVRKGNTHISWTASKAIQNVREMAERAGSKTIRLVSYETSSNTLIIWLLIG